MGQRSAYLLDRQGSAQFWSGAWDSEVNYSSLFLNFFFITSLLSTFIRGKNSVNYFFLKKNNLLPELLANDNLEFNGEFSYADNSIQKKSISKKFFFLLGSTWIFKYHNWVVFCISIFRPVKKKKPLDKKSKVKYFLNFFEKKKENFELFF